MSARARRGELRELAETSPEALKGLRVRNAWLAELSDHDRRRLIEMENRMAKNKQLRVILAYRHMVYYLSCAEREAWPTAFESQTSPRVQQAQRAARFWRELACFDTRLVVCNKSDRHCECCHHSSPHTRQSDCRPHFCDGVTECEPVYTEMLPFDGRPRKGYMPRERRENTKE